MVQTELEKGPEIDYQLSKEEEDLLELWIMLFFDASEGQPIKGKTMLMKQLFILANEINPKLNKLMDFFPAKYGPLSNNAGKIINTLRASGFIGGEKEGRDLVFKITEDGKNHLQKISKAKEIEEEKVNKIPIMKEATLQWGLKKLLHYVYTRYPEYTISSKIRGNIIG